MQDDDKIHWLLITKFLILTGMRITEFLELTKRDIDLQNKLIHVYKYYNVSTGNINLKTPNSAREIFIQPELYHLCLDINYFIEQQDLDYTNKAAPLFFPSKSGGYLNCFAYQRYLKNTSKHVLLRCISSHVLRNSHASLLQAQGVSKDAIAWRLGYEDRTITRDVNSPLWKKQVEDYNQQLAKTKIIL